jgi:hypothetical protein
MPNAFTSSDLFKRVKRFVKKEKKYNYDDWRCGKFASTVAGWNLAISQALGTSCKDG